MAILGLPCPTLIRSGLQKVLQAAPARGSVFLPPPEGIQEACVLGALGSAQGWLTCSLGWMALDVSHGPGRQAGPSPASRPQPCHAATAQLQRKPLYPLPLPPYHTHTILGGCIGWATETRGDAQLPSSILGLNGFSHLAQNGWRATPWKTTAQGGSLFCSFPTARPTSLGNCLSVLGVFIF